MRIYIKNILKNLDYDLIWAYFGNKNINKEKLIENVKRRITTKKNNQLSYINTELFGWTLLKL